MPLIIAAKVEPELMNYFTTYVQPRLSQKIQWVGEVDEKKRNELMSKATCLLHPVTWREPFGLTLIESMACGTPVVAFNQGSIPEIIQNGKTGFVVHDTDEMIEAVKNIDRIDRATCRDYARISFSAEKMAKNYEEIYRKVLAQRYGNILSFDRNFSRFMSLPSLITGEKVRN